jgi:hypothetical protein
VIKNNTWIVSGGMKARVFYSADKGNTWDIRYIIVQGKRWLAFYTADFYDAKEDLSQGGL